MQDDERMTGRDELDSRIDAALRSYTEPQKTTEPRVALARLMEQARAEQRERGIRWWMWGVTGAAACAVAAMVAIWILWTPRLPHIARGPKAPDVVALPIPASHAALVSSPEVRRTTHHGRSPAPIERAATRSSLPKLDVFPTPQPLSPQEQALVAFAKHGPRDVQRAVLQDQQHWDDPIIVADLQKQPQPTGSQQDR
ncbi:MAG TPA: hypothetical protein VGG42_06795 [Acidobacteriaceae bacterium]